MCRKCYTHFSQLYQGHIANASSTHTWLHAGQLQAVHAPPSLTRADDAVVALGGLQPQLVLDGPARGGHRLRKAAGHLQAQAALGAVLLAAAATAGVAHAQYSPRNNGGPNRQLTV